MHLVLSFFFLISFDLEQFFNLFLIMTLKLFKILGQLFAWCLSIYIYLMWPHDLIQVIHSWQEYHKNNAVLTLTTWLW